MAHETLKVSPSIIDQINSIEGEWKIIAFDNNVTPFQVVWYVLRTVVPLEDEKAFAITQEIHEKGSAIVYTGTKSHCTKIASALAKINVVSLIEK
jgi:ATP-dependent Clp protease adapter protein ClpS